jgi:hypothetical protein
MTAELTSHWTTLTAGLTLTSYWSELTASASAAAAAAATAMGPVKLTVELTWTSYWTKLANVVSSLLAAGASSISVDHPLAPLAPLFSGVEDPTGNVTNVTNANWTVVSAADSASHGLGKFLATRTCDAVSLLTTR